MSPKRLFDLHDLTLPQLERLMSETQVEIAVRKEALRMENERIHNRDETARSFCSEVLKKQRLASRVAPSERLIQHPSISNLYAIVGFKFNRDGEHAANGWAQVNTVMIWDSPRVIHDGQLGKKNNLRRVFIVELQEKDLVRVTGSPTFGHEVINKLNDYYRVDHGVLTPISEGDYYRSLRQLRLLELLEPTLKTTESKLLERQNGVHGEEKVTQLMEVFSELREIRTAILDGKVPSPEQRVVLYKDFALSEWTQDADYIKSLRDVVEQYAKL